MKGAGLGWLRIDRLSNIRTRQNCQLCPLIQRVVAENLDLTKESPLHDNDVGDDPYVCVIFYKEALEIFLQYRDLATFRPAGKLHVATRHNSVPRERDYPFRFIEKRILWDEVKSWLQSCAECSTRPKVVTPRGFRLIDVGRRCIVDKLPLTYSFAALSYVWGGYAGATLTISTNIAAFMKEGALSGLPRTIEDAMTICRKLDIMYLWVDQICIIQDDNNDIAAQFHAMDKIYTSASVVLLSCFGDNMNCGLPGVDRDRNTTQTGAVIHDLAIATSVSTTPYTISTWRQRAWTYQESVLSRKKLIFTSTQLYYACPHQMRYEDCYQTLESTESNEWAHPIMENVLFRSGEEDEFDAYFRHVAKYNKRQLTYETDIYKAFAGISGWFYSERGGVLHGLPRAEFDYAMLWHLWDSYGGASRRLEAGGTMRIPTWSWASLHGVIHASDMRKDLLGPLVQWYECVDSHSKKFRLVNTSDRCQLSKAGQAVQNGEFPQWRLVFLAAWQHGFFASKTSLPWILKYNLDELHALTEKRWPNYSDFYAEAFGEAALNICNMMTNLNSQIFIDSSILLTNAQSAFFDVEEGQLYHKVVNAAGEGIGEIRDTGFELKAQVEMIAVSLSRISLTRLTGDKPVWDPTPNSELTFFDSLGNALEVVPVVNVLAIEWHGQLARRLGTGWIFLTKWAAAKPITKQILLE